MFLSFSCPKSALFIWVLFISFSFKKNLNFRARERTLINEFYDWRGRRKTICVGQGGGAEILGQPLSKRKKKIARYTVGISDLLVAYRVKPFILLSFFLGQLFNLTLVTDVSRYLNTLYYVDRLNKFMNTFFRIPIPHWRLFTRIEGK